MSPYGEPQAPNLYDAEPIPAAAIIEDTFHNDPLIQAALIKFEGKVLA